MLAWLAFNLRPVLCFLHFDFVLLSIKCGSLRFFALCFHFSLWNIFASINPRFEWRYTIIKLWAHSHSTAYPHQQQKQQCHALYHKTHFLCTNNAAHTHREKETISTNTNAATDNKREKKEEEEKSLEQNAKQPKVASNFFLSSNISICFAGIRRICRFRSWHLACAKFLKKVFLDLFFCVYCIHHRQTHVRLIETQTHTQTPFGSAEKSQENNHIWMCVLPVHMFSPFWQQKNTFCLRFSIKLSNLASQFALCSAKDLASQREAPSFRQAKFIDSNDIEHKICQINKYKMKTLEKQHETAFRQCKWNQNWLDWFHHCRYI